MAAKKKVVRKKQDNHDDDIRVVASANLAARTTGDGRKGSEPPKIHAKVLHLIVSAGTDDRERSIEQFIDDVNGALDPVSKRVTVASKYYILDGKVCLPDDYDHEGQTFKPGAVPPSWAGGPSRTTYTKPPDPPAAKDDEEEEEIDEFDWDESDITSDEFAAEMEKEATKKAVKKIKRKKR